jgi:signal transduction histidine kinase
MESILHLNQVVEKLLFLARSDAKLLPVKREQTDTVAFVANFVEDAELLATSKGLSFDVGCNEKGSASIDTKWIKQVLYNLLSNALKWSPRQGVISLESRHINGHWSLRIKDEGPGVPKQELEVITRRFSRASTPGPAGAEQVGIGLGLAICKSLLHLHEGTLSCHNRKDSRGFEVEFQIPAHS